MTYCMINLLIIFFFTNYYIIFHIKDVITDAIQNALMREAGNYTCHLCSIMQYKLKYTEDSELLKFIFFRYTLVRSKYRA